MDNPWLAVTEKADVSIRVLTPYGRVQYLYTVFVQPEPSLLGMLGDTEDLHTQVGFVHRKRGIRFLRMTEALTLNARKLNKFSVWTIHGFARTADVHYPISRVVVSGNDLLLWFDGLREADTYELVINGEIIFTAFLTNPTRVDSTEALDWIRATTRA